jgi:hypothetical protein
LLSGATDWQADIAQLNLIIDNRGRRYIYLYAVYSIMLTASGAIRFNLIGKGAPTAQEGSDLGKHYPKIGPEVERLSK